MENRSWIVKIILTSVTVSVVFTIVSDRVIGEAGYAAAFIALTVFVMLGIVFDIIGVAVTSASEAPFHSMAARRERGAVEAIRLIKSAGKVSSVCNDIVGDISGIVSGTTAALIAARLASSFTASDLVMQVVISAAVTGVTIGGKAAGKLLAMSRTTEIMLRVGRVLSYLPKKSKER